MPRYQQKIITLSDGSRLYLPGLSSDTYPAVASDIDIFDVNTASFQQFPLGTKLEIGDNVFRYVEFGGTTASGDVVQTEAPDGAHDDLAAGTTGSIDGVSAAVSAGSKVIHISSSITVVENEYAGGYLVTETDTGAGYAYMIEQHTGDGGAGTDHLFLIKHGLAVAIDTTTDVKLVKSRFQEVIECPVTLTGIPVGVSCAIGADGSFGWIATRGPWAVLTEGTVTIGMEVRPSESGGTAGAVTLQDYDEADDANLGTIGRCMDVGGTGEFSLIYLQIE